MNEHTCDVVILGGAFSGAATALLIKRAQPGLRVVIIERAEAFDRKVGESTTEVSSCFLTRTLGMANYLGHHHLAKQGLRMWFARSEQEAFADCVELGAMYNSRLAGFQVDRATLDEHMLAQAVTEGCELWRPARITGLSLEGAGKNTITVQRDGAEHKITARYVADASGRSTLIARNRRTLEPMPEHPTNAYWARFTGVKDWDGPEMRKKFPKWVEETRAARGWATNHLCGLGWWVWIIPLKNRGDAVAGTAAVNGEVSIGLVYDTRLYTPPQAASIGEKVLAHCRQHPVGREMFADARVVEDDQKAYHQLPYRVTEVAGDGWGIVGDAAGFLDPLYSPGLDFCSFTAQGVANLALRTCAGELVDTACYNRRFAFCFRSWFECIYRDKYYYMGDAELMAAAFLMDVATYHLGPVKQVYSDPDTQFGAFPFDGRPGRIASKLIAFYNRRLSHLARRKIAAGKYGEMNAGWRLLVGGFTPCPKISGRLLFDGIVRWVKMEIASCFWPKPRKTSELATEPVKA